MTKLLHAARLLSSNLFPISQSNAMTSQPPRQVQWNKAANPSHLWLSCFQLWSNFAKLLHFVINPVSFKEKTHRGGIDIQTWCRAVLVCSNNICSNNIWWISGHVLWEADFSVDITNFQSQSTPRRKIMMIKLKVKSLPLFDLTIVFVQASLCLKRLQKGCSTVHNKSWQNCCQRCYSCQESAACLLLMKIDIVPHFKLPPCYAFDKKRRCSPKFKSPMCKDFFWPLPPQRWACHVEMQWQWCE